MRILICGAGAIGCFLGGHLALSGQDVTLLARAPLADAVEKKGLTLRLRAGTQTIHKIKVITELIQASGNFDLIAFTMKAYDTVATIHALEAQSNLLHTPIVSFQNGIGNEESLRSALGTDLVIAGTITTPVTIMSAGEIVEEKERGIAIALDSAKADVVLQAFKKTSLRIDTTVSSHSLKWSKLLLNMLGNASSAILDMLPYEVYAHSSLFAVERAAFMEALSILQMKKIPVINLPGMPAWLLATAMPAMPPMILRPILQQRVGADRGNKPPSLLMALRNHQRRTEVAWLNGAVTQAAQEMNYLAPVNHTLALIVSDIAAGRVPWLMFQGKPEILIASIHSAQGMAL
jgi:2-dehydropantoate 2-reductase